LQLLFANFEKGQVLPELPVEAQYEPNWVAVFVASGLHIEDQDEPAFVHLRWRYRAGPKELAVMPTPLHFSTASRSVRTRVMPPVGPPEWGLDCPHRTTRIVAWIKWVAWMGAERHQLAFRVLQKPKRKGKHKKSGKTRSGHKDSMIGESTKSESSESEDAGDGDSKSGKRHELGGEPDYESVTGWIELPPVKDGLEIKVPEDEDDDVNDDRNTDHKEEKRLLAHYNRRLPPGEWNELLFRRYKDDEEEFYDAARMRGGGRSTDAESTVSGRSSQSRASRRGARGSVENVDQALAGGGQNPSGLAGIQEKSRASQSNLSSGASGSRHGRSRHKPGDFGKFRMVFGMVVEWRLRISDGMSWSDWSQPSLKKGLVPPVPEFPMPVHITFSKREPTIARVKWSICNLPAGYEHLTASIDYVVYLTSDENTAADVLQAGQGTFSETKLHAKGLKMSEGSCGVVENFSAAEREEALARTGSAAPNFDLEELFTEASDRRTVGKFSQADARWINFSSEGAEQTTGFELTVSGLKPEAVHRISVRARCSTAGLDELDWQKTASEPGHPLRWSEPQHASPVLTPKAPPPLLVPEAIPIPEGRFARFIHTPCVLLKCPLFKKAHPDDFDREHPVVLDVRNAGTGDESFQQVPLENSVYCEVDGPCRLLYNLPHLHAEVRARNITMNYISAASTPFFAVAPMVIETRRGPSAELVVGDDGNICVQLTWASRCLPSQEPKFVQISIKRHSVEAPSKEMPAIEVIKSMVMEEVPSNAVLAAGDVYQTIAEDVLRKAAEAEEDAQAKAQGVNIDRGGEEILSTGQGEDGDVDDAEDAARSDYAPSGQEGAPSDELTVTFVDVPNAAHVEGCPFACRHCFRPLGLQDQAPSRDLLGPVGLSRLEEVQSAIEDGTVPFCEVPSYRGWEDEMRLLRAPHRAEVEAQLRERADKAGGEKNITGFSVGGKQARGPFWCGCRDVVIRKILPVDGDTINHGSILRFRLRVTDGLTWSSWTEFSAALPVNVPPPRPSMPLRDPQSPVPPPSVEVQLVAPKAGPTPETALADLVGFGGASDVRLRLRWPRFEGRTKDVEYRVLMWTLSPQQRSRASKRQPLEAKARGMLPPVIGTQTFVMNTGMHPLPVQVDDKGNHPRLGGEEEIEPPLALAKPRAQAALAEHGGDVSVQHGADAPQVIAHVRPFEPPPRANALRHVGKAKPSASSADAKLSPLLNVEASVLALPKGDAYVFGVEAKHGLGTCGNVGDWSAPLFSKLVEFDYAPRQLSLEIDARFGALLFKGQTSTKAKPTDEKLTLEAPAVNFVDEHRELPTAMPLTPGGDPWPMSSSTGKYVARTGGRNAYSERLEKTAEERRPHGDDRRGG